jgi:AI-2 transport protein TqsA
MKLVNTASIIVITLASVFLLIIGKSIILPLILAIFVWFFIREIRKMAQRIPFIGKRLPKWVLNFLALIVLYLFLGGTMYLLVDNMNEIMNNLSTYETNLNVFKLDLNTQFNIDIEALMGNFVGEIKFSSLIGNLITGLTEILGNTFMIALYLLFILIEETLFKTKILSLFPSSEKQQEVTQILQRIGDSVSSYIALKTFIGLLTGCLSFIVLLIIGVDSALFWSFLIFILSFIPSIGALFAAFFTALMALLQFGDLNMALLVLLVIGIVQMMIGNFLEPKVMGNSLNVSSFIVILSLSIWGAIWGITGMVLSVPITVIMVIIFGEFEQTKNIAILLSEKGKLANPLRNTSKKDEQIENL